VKFRKPQIAFKNDALPQLDDLEGVADFGSSVYSRSSANLKCMPVIEPRATAEALR
jgi:hypothetical protein